MTDILLDPLLISVVLLLLFIAWLGTRNARRSQPTLGLLMLFVLTLGLAMGVGSPAVVNPLIDRFEADYPPAPACSLDYTPLVVLGGGVDSRIRSVEQIQYMSQATLQRISEGLRLIRAQEASDYPIILAGGGRAGMGEAHVMQHFLRLTGVRHARLVIEPDSASTAANAENVAQLFDQNEWVKSIRLVSSALHMQRAAGVFRHQGFEVCAVGTDRQALQDVPYYALAPQTTVLLKTKKLWHEMIGILCYRFRGLMSARLPNTINDDSAENSDDSAKHE